MWKRAVALAVQVGHARYSTEEESGLLLISVPKSTRGVIGWKMFARRPMYNCAVRGAEAYGKRAGTLSTHSTIPYAADATSTCHLCHHCGHSAHPGPKSQRASQYHQCIDQVQPPTFIATRSSSPCYLSVVSDPSSLFSALLTMKTGTPISQRLIAYVKSEWDQLKLSIGVLGLRVPFRRCSLAVFLDSISRMATGGDGIDAASRRCGYGV